MLWKEAQKYSLAMCLVPEKIDVGGWESLPRIEFSREPDPETRTILQEHIWRWPAIIRNPSLLSTFKNLQNPSPTYSGCSVWPNSHQLVSWAYVDHSSHPAPPPYYSGCVCLSPFIPYKISPSSKSISSVICPVKLSLTRSLRMSVCSPWALSMHVD